MGLRKENGQLKLFLLESKNSNGRNREKSNRQAIIEIPYKDEDGKRYWNMDKTLVNKYYFRKRIKKVFVQVAAREIDNNTIELINWYGNSTCRNAVTYISYPEFKATYVKK